MQRPVIEGSGNHADPDFSTYNENADFWVQIIRDNHDRYRTGLTDGAVLNAIGPANGLQVVDAGCGEGYMSRELASQGADVLGVDSSANLIQAASALNDAGITSPRFFVGDVADLKVKSDSQDLVVCNHLLNDLPDARGPIAEFARVLKPGGRIVILMLHPCFYNDRSARASGDNDELASSYFTQRKVTQRFNVDGIVSPAEVTSWHRPLEFYIQGLTNVGFYLTSLSEPHPTQDQVESDPWWVDHFRRPLFLLLSARMPS